MLFNFVLLGAVASTAIAATIKRDNTLVQRSDMPTYCYIDKINAANDYTYDDESSVCSFHGIGSNCCSTFIGDGLGTCPPVGDQTDTDNLMLALSQQLAKDGQTQSSTVGDWMCGFTLFTTAIPNQGVEDEWFRGIQNLAAGVIGYGGSPLSYTYFELDGNVIECIHNC